MPEVYTVKVEEGQPATADRPAKGPVYRSIYAKDGLPELPEGRNSPWDFFSATVKRIPKSRLLGRREVVDTKVGPYVWLSYQEAYDSAVQVGSAIRRRSVNPGDRCGIYGSNCPEWVIAMEACSSQAITYVPLYDTLGPNAVEFILNHAEVSIAFVQTSKIPAGSSDSELPAKQKTDICTIMYTSGTTGEPKGVVLTNGAVMTEVLSIDQFVDLTDKVFSEEDVYFSFLPLAHIYDLTMEIYCMYRGSAIGFWRGDVRFLVEDIQELKPTIFCGVPRVYDRIYSGILAKVSSGGAIRKKLFEFAYNYKLGNLEKGLPLENAAPLMDRLVFEKTKLAFGGRVRILSSGAAPLPRHVEEFLRVTTCSSLSQGYGLTESCGGCTTSVRNVFSMVGTVGVPIPSMEMRLESVPEMGYDALSSTYPRGEICLRGTTLFSGYYKRPDLTNDVFVDGWFHTGDVGEWQPDGALKIIDRKKNIFKLSQGEYVAVENVESVYLRSPVVTSIWVYGNSFESFLVAVVVPDRKVLEEWATSNSVEVEDFPSLCRNLKARKFVLNELNKAAQHHKLRGFEMLKAVYLEPNLFDMERDLITPTFKLKRPQLLKYYKDCIDQLYIEAKGTKA
ncbi:hypothetical protein CDL15_Pgr004201 [Punica granatum]|uniref:Long-chain-fatty-acid--CoA ligase n=1 Tax=Punica granatum TaxID=22663 RepID=A0A218XG92_PUNGR|nr:hypothetical protein CDL15_Pgr004201 [Punica granatum]